MAILNTGWVAPGTFSGWTNSANAAASDNLYATRTASGWLVAGPVLRCSNFGLALPAGATVTNVEVSVEGSYTATNGVTPDYVGTVNLSIRKDVSDTSTGTSGMWPSVSDLIGTTEAVRTASIDPSAATASGSTVNTWAPADFNASTFGVVFPAAGTTGNYPTGGSIAYKVDQIRLRITYDDGAVTPIDLPYTNANSSTQAYSIAGPTYLAYANANASTQAYIVESVVTAPIQSALFWAFP